MEAERVVEVAFGPKSAGSGYLITSNHVLTARHVLPATALLPGSPCTVRPLMARGITGRPDALAARVGWVSPDLELDAAILEVITERPASQPLQRVVFGRVLTNDLAPWAFLSTGFPEAAGAVNRTVQGFATYVPPVARFDLDLGFGLPRDWRQWAGMSGAAVFCASRLIGIVRTVDSNFEGKLTAVPTQRLVEDAGFTQYWADQQCLAPAIEDVRRIEPSMLERISEHVYLIDRKNPLEKIKQHLKTLSTNAPSSVIAIAGLDDDEHRHLIRQLSECPEVKQLLGRDANSEHVIVPLPWPLEEQIGDLEQKFNDLIQPLCATANVPMPPAGQSPDVEKIRVGFDGGTTPRAYWTRVRRKIAFGGHTELLRRLLLLWEAIGSGAPALLFVCLAWDSPPRRRTFGLQGLLGSPPKYEQELELEINHAKERLQGRLQTFGPLEHIDMDHIGPWIEELRVRCHSMRAGQLEGLRLALLHKVQQPTRLRLVEAALGDLLTKL